MEKHMRKKNSKAASIRHQLNRTPSLTVPSIAGLCGASLSQVYAERKKLNKEKAAYQDHDAHISAHMVAVEKFVITANAVQVGGTHYKTKTLQPWDAIIAWDMGFLAGNAVKYLVRFQDKGGVEDLKKARHYIDKLIEVEVAK
jgi:hypothetical protein